MTNKPLIAYGDSNTLGHNLPSPSVDSYIAKLAAGLGVTRSVRAANGRQCADAAWTLYGTTPSDTYDYTFLLGTNDCYVYGNSPVKRTAAVNFLRNLLVWTLCPSKIFARPGPFIYTGTWANTGANSVGKSTGLVGSKAVATVNGTAVYVSYILQNHAPSEGEITVTIDGVAQPPLQMNGTLVGNTQLGRTYSGACARFGGLSDGPHVVEFESTLAGKTVFLEYIAGSDQATHPRVFVGEIMRFGAYAGTNSDANVDAYNADIDAMVADLAADGHTISRVHYPAFNPTIHYQADGIHPNVAGHAVIAAAFEGAIEGPPPPPPEHTFTEGKVWKRDDGLWFVGITEPETEIS